MGLTLLSIPFLVLGVFLKPYDEGALRCLKVAAFSNTPYCFEQASMMPEIIKYGCFAVAMALIFAGRKQIRRARGLD